MKKLLTIILILYAFDSHAQRTFFGSQNNYVAPLITPTGPAIVTNGLTFHVDAAISSSYSGSGNVWNDLSGSNHMKFYTNSSYNVNANPTFSSDGGGSLITTGIFGKSMNNSGITGAAPRSFEAWVKFNSITSNAVMSIGSSPCNSLFELMAYQNNIIDHIWCAYLPSSTVLSTNTWYHVIITYDGTTNHFVYINGVQVAASSSFNGQSSTLTTLNTPIYIGPAVTTTWGAFNGKIGVLRIYDRVLSPSEITTNFNALHTRFGL
jgi:hypothetical protein